MIGYLEGKIKHSTSGKVILFTNGIGFVIQIPANLIYSIGDQATFFIHTHMREDSLALFGFATPEDLDLFEKLITVSGVGPKTALNIFSQASTVAITEAISSSNLNFFTSISGIGKKSAQKIILDLKSKISKGDINMDNLEGNSELLDSLISLGFQKVEISKIYSQIDHTADLSTQIKTALRILGKK